MKENSFQVIEEKLKQILYANGNPRDFEAHFISFIEMHHLCAKDRIGDDYINELNIYCLHKKPGVFITRVTDGYVIAITGINISFKAIN